MFYPSVDNLFDEMFNFDEDFFEPKPERGLLPSHRGPKGRHGELMRTDVKETKKAYKLNIDLPGYKKDDIKVKFDDGVLTVSAEKVEENEEEKDGKVIRQERFSGAIRRSWYVGEDIKREEIAAKYENGVLKLTVPKSDPKEALPEDKKYIAIEG